MLPFDVQQGALLLQGAEQTSRADVVLDERTPLGFFESAHHHAVTHISGIRRAFPGARMTHIYASTEAGAEGIQRSHLRISNGLLEVCSPRQIAGYVGLAAGTPFVENPVLDSGKKAV